MLKTTERQLLELTKVGLWGATLDVHLFKGHPVDWNKILELSDQQTIVGVVTDALSMLPIDLRPPKDKYFLFIKKTDEIEKMNLKLYDFIPTLIGKLESHGIRTWLLKGQGVGLCYRNPYRRMSGDVDLFVGFDEDYFCRVISVMEFLGAKKIKEQYFKLHVEYVLNNISIEIHGEIKVNVSKRLNRNFKIWMNECLKESFIKKKSKSFSNIYLPPYRFDVIFIFIHILSHYMNSGVGLRQICDWACYLTKYHEKIDMNLLQKDIDYLGLTHFWKIFAAMVVNRLGMNKELMPLYDDFYNEEGDKILSHIFLTGNFGVLQDRKMMKHCNNIFIRTCMFIYGRFSLYWDNLWLFPHETIFCFRQLLMRNIKKIKS